jgi:hypothetical protein
MPPAGYANVRFARILNINWRTGRTRFVPTVTMILIFYSHLDTITAQFEKFLAFPEMGRRREEFGRDYRSFVVSDYVIFYRILGETIEISRVLHGSRNLEDFL